MFYLITLVRLSDNLLELCLAEDICDLSRTNLAKKRLNKGKTSPKPATDVVYKEQTEITKAKLQY